MRIFLCLLFFVALCCLLTGCMDSFVGTWQPIEVTAMGQTVKTTEQEKTDGTMTISKEGSTYTYTAKDGQAVTGKKDGDKIVFTEGAGMKCELTTDSLTPGRVEMRFKSDEMSQATQGLSSTVIMIEYERAKAR